MHSSLSGRRVALVIGNGAYVHVKALPNPSNDARSIGKSLRDIGFSVTEGIDLDRGGMQTMIRDFLREAARACRDGLLHRPRSPDRRPQLSRTRRCATLGAGTLIAFATAPGQVALDGEGANRPFSAALSRHIGTPGLEVQQMLTRVRAVVAATKSKQVPWSNSSLLGEVFLAAKP